MPNSTATSGGRAVVLLRSGLVYEGDVTVEAPFVHITSTRRRVGRDEDLQYRPADDHTWPAAKIESIRWVAA